MREMLPCCLVGQNIEMAVVRSGAEADAQSARAKPDLVVLDLHLDGENKPDLLCRLRELLARVRAVLRRYRFQAWLQEPLELDAYIKLCFGAKEVCHGSTSPRQFILAERSRWYAVYGVDRPHSLRHSRQG